MPLGESEEEAEPDALPDSLPEADREGRAVRDTLPGGEGDVVSEALEVAEAVAAREAVVASGVEGVAACEGEAEGAKDAEDEAGPVRVRLRASDLLVLSGGDPLAEGPMLALASAEKLSVLEPEGEGERVPEILMVGEWLEVALGLEDREAPGVCVELWSCEEVSEGEAERDGVCLWVEDSEAVSVALVERMTLALDSAE